MESQPAKSISSTSGIIETAEDTVIGIGESMLHAPEVLIGTGTRRDIRSNKQPTEHTPSVDAAQGMRGALQDSKDDVSRINEQVSHTKEDVKKRLGEKMEQQGENARQKGLEMQGKSQVSGFGDQIRSITQSLNPFKEQ